MHLNFNPVLAAYFARWWLPAAVAAAPTLALGLLAFYGPHPPVDRLTVSEVAAEALTLGALLGWLGLIAAVAWHWSQRRWGQAAFNLVMVPVIGMALFVAFSHYALNAFLDPG